MRAEMDSLRFGRENAAECHRREIEKMESFFSGLVLENQREIEEKKREEMPERSAHAAAELADQNAAEMEAARAAIRASEKSAGQRIRRLRGKPSQMSRAHWETIQRLKADRVNNERRNLAEREAFESESRNEMEFENTEWTEKQTKLRTDLESAQSVLEAVVQQQAEEFRLLENQRISLIRAFQAQIEEFDETDVKDAFEKAEAALKRDESRSLETVALFQTKLTEERQRLWANEKREFTLKTQTMASAFLKRIGDDEGFQHEFDNLLAGYKGTYDALEQEFSRIECPNLHLHLDLLDADIQELEKSKRDSIPTKRRALQLQWQQRFDSEDSRHLAAIPQPNSNHGRTQILRSLEDSSQFLRHSLFQEAGKLQETLAQMKMEHESEMVRLSDLKDQVSVNEEIETLRYHLTAVLSHHAEVSVLEDRVRREIEVGRHAAHDLGFEMANQINEMNENVIRLQSEFAREHLLLTEEFTQIVIADDAALKKQSDSHRQLFHHAKHAHYNEVARLEHSFAREHATLGESSEKFLRQKTKQAARLELRLSDTEKTFRRTKREQEECSQSFLAFYTEKIAVLEAQLRDMTEKCTGRQSRESELTLIEQLTRQLQALQTKLTGALTDLKESKSMLIEQEHVYNRYFGRNARVGVLPLRSHS
jgi:hypothetical protein